ncbi:MAG: hypothetical protein V1837_06475 [Candidatus Woesearchaeota archaeon]
MISLDLGNIYIDEKEIEPLLSGIRRKQTPEFTIYKENIAKLKAALKPYSKLKNLIVIGQGGSINSFKACKSEEKKRVSVLNTNEPDAIAQARKQYPRNSTLVMCISKSGETISSIEALMSFADYKVIIITEDKQSTLREMARKKKWKIIEHPNIPGRYAGISSCSYAALTFVGVDAAEIDKGAKEMYDQCSPENHFNDNPALQLATAMFLLELQGKTEVYMPVYSTKLANFLPLIIQLMHESVCKSGKGLTFYGDLGPECQHHTNQRFFGGKRNVIGLFTRVKEFEENETEIKVPKGLQKISMKGSVLGMLDKLPYAKALDFEFLGVREHTIHYKIPYALISTGNTDEKTCGELMAFWHYVAIYSAWLRNVDPFDQPEVEFAKKHSFELTKNFRR